MKWLMLRPSVRPPSPPSHSRAAHGRRRAQSWPRAYLGGISPLHSDGPQRLRFFQGEVKNNAKVSLSFVKKAFLTWVNGIPEYFRECVNDFSPLLLRGRT